MESLNKFAAVLPFLSGKMGIYLEVGDSAYAHRICLKSSLMSEAELLALRRCWRYLAEKLSMQEKK